MAFEGEILSDVVSLSKTTFKSCEKWEKNCTYRARCFVFITRHIPTKNSLSNSVRYYYYSVVSIGEDPDDGDDDALIFSSSSLSGDKPLPLVLLRKRGETETF